MRSLLIAALLLSLPVSAQTLVASELDARIEALRGAYGTPGLAVAVVQGEKVIYARGFGHRDIERRQPVTVETVFPIGSVTKQFTASLMGVYEGEGRLSLTDRPAEHVPALRFRTVAMNEVVSIEDLMAHTSGIGGVDGALVYFPVVGRQTLLASRLAHLEPGTEVRERLAYSNAAYGLLGTLAEHVSGRSWSDEIHARLFRPLGMDRSSTSIPALEATGNIARGYGMVDGRPEPVLYEDLHESSPGGAINSTALDMAAWVTMLMNQGQYEGAQILPSDFLARAFSIRSFWTPSYDPDEGALDLDGYGYGWGISEFEGRLQIMHSGAVSGFTARIAFLPSEDIGVVVLTNQHVSGIPDWVVEIVYRQMLGLPPRETSVFPVNVAAVPPIVRDSASVRYPDLNHRQPPTHGLAAFTGDYMHPGYGTFTVELRDGALYAHLPTLSFALEHERANVFRLRRYYEVHVNTPSLPVNFQVGYDGSVMGAEIPFQAPPVAPILFVRDTDALRAELRGQLDDARVLTGDAQAQAVAAALRSGLDSGVYTEATINALGYDYLQSNGLAVALAVFRFNAEAHPGSWNVHDSYGEALALAGRTREAITAYERSLALNPSSTTGRTALDRLRSD